MAGIERAASGSATTGHRTAPPGTRIERNAPPGGATNELTAPPRTEGEAPRRGFGLWLGLFFLASSWLYLYGAFTVPNRALGLALVALGAASTAFAFTGRAPRRNLIAHHDRASRDDSAPPRDSAQQHDGPQHEDSTPRHALGARNSLQRLDTSPPRRPPRLDPAYALLLAPLAAAAVLLPAPYRYAPILAALGIAAGCALSRLAPYGNGLMFAGAVMAVQSAVLPLYSTLAERFHETSLLAAPVSAVLRVLGMDPVRAGETVFVRGAGRMQPLAVSWEKAGLLSIMVFAAGAVLLLALTSRRARDYGWLALTLATFMVVRQAALLLAFLDGEDFAIFWVPAASVLMLLPLSLLCMRLFPPARLPRPGRLALTRRRVLALASLFLATVMFVGAIGLHDPGRRKRGRVLVDEKHSAWELTTEKYDTRWFGEKSGYNYYSLYEYLGAYYEIDRAFDEITPEVLEACDVFIVKMPTQAFSGSEIEAIEGFVRAGGGLFLVGDHTNVFGTSTFINPLARRFSLEFRYDATYGLGTGDLTEYAPPSNMPHPVVQRMPPMLFATSSTIKSRAARSAITGSRMESNFADYSQKSFFPEALETARTGFGNYLQAASVTHGSGRVFAFADSTVFSNFWMFMPGKPELALGAVEWLNRENSAIGPSTVLLSLAVVFLLVAVLLARGAGISGFLRRRREPPFSGEPPGEPPPTGPPAGRPRTLGALIAVLAAAALAAAVAMPAVTAFNRAAYKEPAPTKKLERVCFEQEVSDFSLPTSMKEFKAPASRTFLTFYVWTQRLGLVPSVGGLGEALDAGDIVVMINPSGMLTSEKRKDILEYVRGGGVLLVMDSAANRNSTSNRALEQFGLSFENAPLGRKATSFAGRSIVTTARARPVKGGTALMRTVEGQAVLSMADYGKGTVAAFGDSHVFSNGQMGDVGTVPDERLSRISELEFWMFDMLIDGRGGTSASGPVSGR